MGQINFKFIQRWIYVILAIIIMMCLGTVYSWSIFRLSIEETYNIRATESGLPYMTSLVFYSLFVFLTGKYINKYSPRLIISLGAFLVAVGWILSSYAPSIYLLTITYGGVIGAGVGIAYGAPMNVIAKWFPEKKGLAVGIVLIGFGLSPLVTAPLARNLLENYGVMKTFFILGISFGLIIPLLSYPLRYPNDSEENNLVSTTSPENHIDEINTSKMIKTNSFKGLYLNFIIGTTIGLMVVGMTSNVGVELVKLSPNTMALLVSLFAVFNGMGRPTFGWITDKLSSKKTMLISYVLIIIAASLMLFVSEGNIILFSIAFSILWFNLGGWLAIAPTSTLAMYGTKYYSQNYGVVFTAYGIGAITGVLASGMLIDALQNYDYIFYFVIGLCVIGILLSQKMLKTK